MSRPPRRRRDPAVLRGRFRTLFFGLTALVALAAGLPGTAVAAAVGTVIGVASTGLARRRGGDLALTLVALDWILLGLALVFSGGADSWFLLTVPVLAMGHLAGAPRGERPYLVAPSLLLLIVLAIADPSLGGNRAAGTAKVVVLVAGGLVAASRLRPPAARRRRRPPRVDATTGFRTGERLRESLEASMADALAEHSALGVAFVRLEHFEDCRNFLGAEGSEALVKAVARRIERRLGPDGRAFRVGPDSFFLTLPGTSTTEARGIAASTARDVSAHLIGGRRQTLATGASSFPTVRDLDALLAEARDDAAPHARPAEPAASVVPLAAAQ